MKAIAFAEHGNINSWFNKKCYIESLGLKYIHAIEAYLTENTYEKKRDNYHCVLIAKNKEGFKELNSLVSRSFNRKDNHFYYVPRISFEELFGTSDNIIITTACVGGVLSKAEEGVKQRFLSFLEQNRHRVFIEIGHHPDEKQRRYNRLAYDYSKRYGVPLIAGTDTHALNSEHERGRKILQLSKNICFDDEDGWDLKFKTYAELCEAYDKQRALPQAVWQRAIENTNTMADMVEPFTVDCGIKYPHIYENAEQVFLDKINEAREKHPYINKRYNRQEIDNRIKEEFEVFKKTQSIDFMLLQNYLREWERTQGIQCGYSRGSVSGSMIAYILGITQMDSIRFDLNFSRFANPDRVTCADIDTDYGDIDRERVKEFLLKDRMGLPNIKTAEIITFNTIDEKGAVRDVARALEIPLDEVNKISKALDGGTEARAKCKKKYKELFEYAEIVRGTIVSVGSHPSGVLISDLNIAEEIGLCSLSSSDYTVSCLNMKELDALFYVKLDILGLSNIGVINEACRLAGIERLAPDNVDLNDEEVWKSIRDDTTMVFQWESVSSAQYLRKFLSDETLAKARERIKNFSYIKWLSLGNGLIRPACASFRDKVANGEFYDNGFEALNDFLAPEAGRIVMQETIMQFLVRFCGYSSAESDNVRRAIAKKKGTEQLLTEIEQRFVDFSPKHYEITASEAKEIIKPFLQVVLDASDYAFSWNHSDSYSIVGYVCGYLRYYYPLEFITAALNIFGDDMDKTAMITAYAKKRDIKIQLPKFGEAKSKYFFNREKNTISKGLSSVKFINKQVADELYDLSKKKAYPCFTDLLYDIKEHTTVDSRQTEVLISIDFFSRFGNQKELLSIAEIFRFFHNGKAKELNKKRLGIAADYLDIIEHYSSSTTKSGKPSASYILNSVPIILQKIEERIKEKQLDNIPIEARVKAFNELMGYNGYITGKEGDRRTLIVKRLRSNGDTKTIYK